MVISASDAVGVDTSTSQVSSSISDRTLTNLPLNGRNYLDLHSCCPAPARAKFRSDQDHDPVSSAGQLGRGGNIDRRRRDNDDDDVGGTLQNFPQDGVQEFQIITNRFSADIGRSASSAINVATKTGGTNCTARRVLLRHDALSALPATSIAGSSRRSGGRHSTASSTPVRSAGLSNATGCGFSPRSSTASRTRYLTGVRDLGQRRILTSSRPRRCATRFTGRGDWQTTANDRMAFRYALQRENDVDRGSLGRPIGTADNRQQSFNNYQSFVYNWAHTFSPRLLNDFVFHENNFINRIPTFVENRNELRFPRCRTAATSASRSARARTAFNSATT